MTTPNYVKEAVLAYMENGNSDPLATMFEHGIPLHEYPESREIVSNCIRGIRNRKPGRQPLTREEKSKQESILYFVAQLHGAGFSLINSGERSDGTTSKNTACEIVARFYGYKSGKYIYDSIWKPAKDSEIVKFHMEIGANNKELFERFRSD